MAENTLKPELLAVIRRKSDGKTLVVAKHGEVLTPESPSRNRDVLYTLLESGLNTPRTDA